MSAAPAAGNSSRPNLLPIAAVVSLLVLVLAGTGLFALSFTNTRDGAALAALETRNSAHIAAVKAQVSFKTQVQEWKNILLRGRNTADFATYRAQFERREADVRTELTRAKDLLAKLNEDTASVTQLVADHAALGASYRKALGERVPENENAAHAIDTAVRGIDRPLNDGIDAFATAIGTAAGTSLQAHAADAVSRYESLRKVTLGIALAAVLAAFWLVFQAMQAGRK